jgi:predicted Zn-dependent peptidase
MIPIKRSLVLLLVLVSGASFGDGVTLPDAERVMLDNGTVLILNENHDVPLIGLEAVVRGGAVADPADKHGLASLLANLLVKGANERSSAEFADAVASVGGELDARAGLESISLSAEFMAKDAALMVELVADALQRPTLASEEFEKLRVRSINLIKSAKGSDPNRLMPSYANAFLFGDHPYGNPIGGSESSLARVTHGDLLAYYTDMLGGDRLVISVSGDFDLASMRASLSAAFGGWRAATGSPPVLAVPEPAISSSVYLIDKPGATQSYFYIGNVGVPRGYPRRAELNLANTVFGGRFTSMLVTELRTKSGLSYSARSSLNRYSLSGSVFVQSFTETNTTVEALNVALATLGRLRDGGLDAAMLDSSKNYIMGQFPPLLETARQLAGIFAMLEMNGLGPEYINNYGAALAAATQESVASVIDQVYPPADGLVFVILGDAELIREQVTQYGPVTEISISEARFHP